MDKKLEKRLKSLEKTVNELTDRIEMLERKPKYGDRTKQMADWILSLFEDKDRLPVRVIMNKAKKMGFSTQMISKVRRDMFADKVVSSVGPGQGWCWELYDGE